MHTVNVNVVPTKYFLREKFVIRKFYDMKISRSMVIHSHTHTHTAEELTIYLSSYSQTQLIGNCSEKKSGSQNIKTCCIL